MRVALLTYHAPAGDAIGNQVAEKTAFFLESGADVRVFVEHGRDVHPTVRPHCWLLEGNLPQGDDWKFLFSSDLVIADYGHSYSLLELLPLLAQGRPRIVLDYHGVTPPELWTGARVELLTRGARQRGLVWCADAAIAHSRFARRELLEPTRFPAEHVYAMGYPVPTEDWQAGPPGIDLRNQLGIGDARILLFVGRLAPNKRVPVLVEALALLKELSPPVHAVIVGNNRDVYEQEMRLCRERATALGVTDRLHFLGPVRTELLRDAYRSADVFVMPSRHEGFCIPVIEAMASGLPVVAARAAALPETIGDAGLTFEPDDAADLARQLHRILTPRPSHSSEKSAIAIVSCRYGADFVGGAETSLRAIAKSLQDAGHRVVVFTTCTRTEGNWTNHHPEGNFSDDGISVHRFPIDRHDRERHRKAVLAVLHANGPVPAASEAEYIASSIHSSRLIEVLGQQIDGFDAVVVGPYHFGLTHDVARAFPDKTLLLPCFHDEPLARLRAWRDAYGQVGGILYHSSEEQSLAETRLNLNHPGASCCGTAIDVKTSGNPVRGRTLARVDRPYVVYCGRYHIQKGLPALLDCARQYDREHLDRFTFVFMGEGSVPIPPEPWARDLGFVTEDVKRDVLAGAAALILPSQFESLSLAALEAWAQGIPVLANRRCKVLVGHLRKCGGGLAVDSPENLVAALDDLWIQPEHWKARGRKGQEYVRLQYGSSSNLARSLEQAVRELGLSIAERMGRRGVARARSFDRSVWRRSFAEVVEQVLHQPVRPHREQVEVTPRTAGRTVGAGLETLLVPVRVTNKGTHPALAEGPARFIIRSEFVDDMGQHRGLAGTDVALGDLLMPGQSLAAVVSLSVPASKGTYRIVFRAERVKVGKDRAGDSTGPSLPNADTHIDLQVPSAGYSHAASSVFQLTVEKAGRPDDQRCCSPLLDAARRFLAEADRVRQLPDDYIDVTEGWFTPFKRWIKRKLLGNFKQSYVDVLSRRQSCFNRQVLSALSELAECCATLDSVRMINARTDRAIEKVSVPSPTLPNDLSSKPEVLTALLDQLQRQLAESRERCVRLEEHLNRLEKINPVKERKIKERS